MDIANQKVEINGIKLNLKIKQLNINKRENK